MLSPQFCLPAWRDLLGSMLSGPSYCNPFFCFKIDPFSCKTDVLAGYSGIVASNFILFLLASFKLLSIIIYSIRH